MVNRWLQEDRDILFDEFAQEVELICNGISKKIRAVFAHDPELTLNDEFATKAPYFLIHKSDLSCERPTFSTSFGSFSTLYKEDSGSGIVKVYVGKTI